MPPRVKYIQIASDALIPLLGLLLWDWGLYFILLFYFIDLLADISISVLKSRKIKEVTPIRSVQYMILAPVVFVISGFVIHVAVKFIHPEISFINELISFWTYEELGAQQGYILVPLVWFVAYQQYKMEFIRMKLYTRQTVEELWKRKIVAYGVMTIAAGLSVALSFVITFDDWVYVILIVAASSIYQLLRN